VTKNNKTTERMQQQVPAPFLGFKSVIVKNLHEN